MSRKSGVAFAVQSVDAIESPSDTSFPASWTATNCPPCVGSWTPRSTRGPSGGVASIRGWQRRLSTRSTTPSHKFCGHRLAREPLAELRGRGGGSLTVLLAATPGGMSHPDATMCVWGGKESVCSNRGRACPPSRSSSRPWRSTSCSVRRDPTSNRCRNTTPRTGRRRIRIGVTAPSPPSVPSTHGCAGIRQPCLGRWCRPGAIPGLRR